MSESFLLYESYLFSTKRIRSGALPSIALIARYGNMSLLPVFFTAFLKNEMIWLTYIVSLSFFY